MKKRKYDTSNRPNIGTRKPKKSVAGNYDFSGYSIKKSGHLWVARLKDGGDGYVFMTKQMAKSWVLDKLDGKC